MHLKYYLSPDFSDCGNFIFLGTKFICLRLDWPYNDG